MAKYLRYIAVHSEQQEIVAAIGAARVGHLEWMFEEYATPLPTEDVAKVNVYLTTATSAPATDVLGIATVYEQFDLPAFLALPAADRPRYYLDRLYDALVRCARQYGWDEEPFHTAYRRIIAEGLQFSFFWKKPAASPDRQLKAQAYVEAGNRTGVLLLFTDRDGRELRQVTLSVMGLGPGVVKHMLGRIFWTDPQTVTVLMENGRDFWTCTTEGELEFHYPRAEGGDASGEFDLGKMYYEGTYVQPDQERGLALIRNAAAKGYKHAIAYLRRLEAHSGGGNS